MEDNDSRGIHDASTVDTRSQRRWRTSKKFDEIETAMQVEAAEIAKDARQRYGTHLQSWRARFPTAPPSYAEAQQYLTHLALTPEDEEIVLALLDPLTDGSAFGNPRLVSPRATVGPIGELSSIAALLSNAYPWSIADATMFILSDIAPAVSWLRFEYRHGHGPDIGDLTRRIVIVVHPNPPKRGTSTAELVASAIRSRSDRRGGTKLQSALVTFLSNPPVGSTWADWCTEWNRLHPDSRKQRSNFKRDCTRAWQRLHPDMPVPQPGSGTVAQERRP